jgi:hypothetical protein
MKKDKHKKKLLIKLLKENKITEEQFLFLLDEEKENSKNKIIQHSDGFYET